MDKIPYAKSLVGRTECGFSDVQALLVAPLLPWFHGFPKEANMLSTPHVSRSLNPELRNIRLGTSQVGEITKYKQPNQPPRTFSGLDTLF